MTLRSGDGVSAFPDSGKGKCWPALTSGSLLAASTRQEMNVLEPDNFAPSALKLVLGQPGSVGSAASWVLAQSLHQAGVVKLGWLMALGFLMGGSVL